MFLLSKKMFFGKINEKTIQQKIFKEKSKLVRNKIGKFPNNKKFPEN